MRDMPALGTKCAERFGEILKIAADTEGLWLAAPPTSDVKRNLKVPQLEALYEATYLRIFATFESFIEDSLAHYMSGYKTATYTPSPAQGHRLHRTVSDSLQALYGGKDYILWHNMDSCIKRSRRYLSNCPVETAIYLDLHKLKDYATVRHHIAHNSKDSKAKFLAAATRISGSSHKGKPGKMLRAEDLSDPLNTPKQIRVIVDELSKTVKNIAP